MATLTQYPDALSFSRNLKEVKISSTAEVRFQLKKNSSVLLDERYQPDTSGQVSIDIRDVVTASLSLTIPTEDTFEQTNAVASFSIHLDGSSTAAATFVAVLGGISGAAEQASTFLPANFLTWQTQEKMVTADQPEWLTYYFKGAYTVKAKYYYEDGTDNAVDIFTGAEGKVYSIDCNFSRLTALGTVTGKNMFGVIDVYVADTNGLVLTYVQRYCYRAAASLDKIFLCQNSIGGIDTFLFSGESKFIPELEHTVSSYDDRLVPAVTDAKRRYLQNTGVLTSDAELNLWELFSSLNAYCLRDGLIRRIVLDTSTIEESNIETAGSWSFEYRISDDDGLLNVSRNSGFRPVPPIPAPGILTIIPSTKVVDHTQGSFDVTVKANVSYNEPTCSESWVTIAKKSEGIYTVSYGSNPSISVRNAVIIVESSDGYLSASCSLTQAEKPYLQISPASKQVGSDVGSFDVIITGNVPYNTPECPSDWVTIIKKSEGVYTISYGGYSSTTADRSATITVKSSDGTLTASCSLTQTKKLYLKMTPNDISVSGKEGSFDVTITGNVPYNTPVCPSDWVTITKKSEGVYTVGYTANPSSSSDRWTVIGVESSDGTLTDGCLMIQADSGTYDGVGIKHTNGNIYSASEWTAGRYAASDALGVAIGDGVHDLLLNKAQSSPLTWVSREEDMVLLRRVVTVDDKEEAEKDFEGVGNTGAIIVAVDDGVISGAPAAQWCHDLGYGWYLPSFGEWKKLILPNLTDVNTCLTLIGGDLIALGPGTAVTDFYWASTQVSQQTAACVCNGEDWAFWKIWTGFDGFKVRAAKRLS